MIRMSVTVNVNGLRAYQSNLGTLGRVVSATAAAVDGDAKKSIMARQSKGNPYERGGKTGYHALPGNPPNTDTGNLAGSISHKMTGATSAEVNVNAEYAIPLEIGWIGPSGNHNGPFPFIVPAVDKHTKPFRQAVASVLKGRKP